MLKRIAITGPESTGKTQLTEDLAVYFKTNWVIEYAREYLESLEGNYTIEDILSIAKGQLDKEEEIARKTKGLLFTDTDLTVTKIWSEVVFNSCPAWIEKMFVQHRYDLYLLCYPDIDWEADPLRENPDDRLYLFDRYRKELENAGFNFAIVKGRGDERLENAINFVNRLHTDL
jgi:NadR type nicotinamide-nucleotide adenylyltransferase